MNRKLSLPPRDTLYQLFLVDDLSTKEIAEQLGISRTEVYRYLNHYQIERKGKANKKAPSRDILYTLYVEENLSAQQIAERHNMTAGDIFYYLKKHGIERNRVERNSTVPSRDTLYHLYVEENLPVEQVAEQLGYSRSRIFHFLEVYGIERNRRFTTNVDPPEFKEIPDRPHPRPIKIGNHRQYDIDEDWLRTRYLVDNANTPQIAKELGVSTTTVLEWLHQFAIPIKPRVIAYRDKRQRYGDFSQGQRNHIRKRDYNRCQMCGTTEGDLECHHIIPTRFGGQNSIENGILLCNCCHDKIGFHELNWAEHLFLLQGTKTG